MRRFRMFVSDTFGLRVSHTITEGTKNTSHFFSKTGKTRVKMEITPIFKFFLRTGLKRLKKKKKGLNPQH